MEKAPARAKKADCTKNAPSKLLKKTDAAERTKPREKTKKRLSQRKKRSLPHSLPGAERSGCLYCRFARKEI